ncbi:MAG: epimerase [Ideonella sp.]|nr:epimerase [Ideonella sp.]
MVHEGIDFARLLSCPLDDAVIALGTTIKVAGSQAAFRAVDLDAVVNTARAARAVGARRIAVVSALAQTPSRPCSAPRQGRMQQAVAALGFQTVALRQPSLLLGDRAALDQPARSGEAWAARLLGRCWASCRLNVRPIEAATVARAMVRALDELPPGVHFLPSARLQQLRRTSG